MAQALRALSMGKPPVPRARSLPSWAPAGTPIFNDARNLQKILFDATQVFIDWYYPMNAWGTSDEPRPVQLGVKWLTGMGPDIYLFDETSLNTQQLKDAPKTIAAREFLYAKYDRPLQDGDKLTGYKAPFGYSEYLRTFNYTEHFVGSYRIDAYINHEKIYFLLSNNSSFQSFTAGLAPDWERASFPLMGNMRQLYFWSEPIEKRGAK